MDDLRKPPGPHSVLGIRHFAAFRRDVLGFLLGLARDHGDLAYVEIFGKKFYLLSHPDDIDEVLVGRQKHLTKDLYTRDLKRALGEGLVTSEGELWRKHRKLASQAFTPKRIRTYADTMVAAAEGGIASWQGGAVLNLHAEMSRVTMDVVGQVLFGADVDADARTVGHAMEAVNEFFSNSPEAYFRVPAWFPTPLNRRFNRAMAEIDGVIYRVIAGRRADPGSGDDLLSTLLAAQDDDTVRMDDRQLRDECVTLFLAGHETTALALVHALYLLSKHPEVRARFQAEVDAVLGGRLPSHADMADLAYTSRVVKEAMRLFPPVWAVGREVAEPFELRGYRLPAGAQLLASQWVVHRDPRWFPDPEAFDPDRWLPDRAKNLPRFAYFPFGAGPRICIGNHFATMEAVLLLALFGQRFHFELVPGQTLQFEPAVTLRPRGPGLKMRLHARRPGADAIREVAASPAA